MQLFVVPRSIPSTFAIIFFSTFFRPPWATQDLSKDRAKHLEIAQDPNFQGKYAVTHDTPATPIVTICHIVADLFMLAFHRAALFRATVLALRERPIPASFAPLGVYIYAVGGESCRNRLTLEGSARLSAQNKAARGTSGRVRRGASHLGLAPAPRAVSPGVFTALRAAMLRRRNTAFSPCDVYHRASAEPSRLVSLSSPLGTPPHFLITC